MSFISKIWNWRAAVTENNYEAHPIFYRVTQEIRQVIIENSKLKFIRRDGEPLLHFVSSKPEPVNDFFATIHPGIKLKQFTVQDTSGAINYCLEWSPEASQLTFDHLMYGCSFKNETQANDFSRILLSIVSSLNPGAISQVKNMKRAPNYMKEEYKPKGMKRQGQINDILLQEAQDEETKMVNSCKLYEIKTNRNILLLENAVFSIKSTAPFEYSFFILDIDGETYLQKQVTSSMSYEVNVDDGEMKWVDLDAEKSKIYKIVFDKYQVAINVQFAFAECLFENKNKKKLRVSIQEQEDKLQSLVIPMEEELPLTNRSRRMETEEPIVNTYVEPLSSSKKRKNVVLTPESQFDEGSKLIFQAKATDRAVICSGEQVNVIRVDKDENIKTLSTNGIIGIHGQTLTPTKIVMHDSDSKAVISSTDGKLIYTDFVKFKPIQQLNPKNLFNDFCPESKLAELGNYNNLIGVTDSGIFTFDPKLKNGSAHKLKEYARNQEFNNVSVREDSSFAIGSRNGNIRLFDRTNPRNASALYPGLGDPVLHMESTKDGRWLLATFKSYIILLPTHTNEDHDLYSSSTLIKERPSPRKLTIKNQHLKYSKSDNLTLLKAKFDENQSNAEKFIISGFGEYIVVWSLQNVISGNLSYTFSKSTGIISDVDFKFNDNKKILTATLKDVHLEHNLLK